MGSSAGRLIHKIETAITPPTAKIVPEALMNIGWPLNGSSNIPMNGKLKIRLMIKTNSGRVAITVEVR